jgi:prephenate dehydrogenase
LQEHHDKCVNAVCVLKHVLAVDLRIALADMVHKLHHRRVGGSMSKGSQRVRNIAPRLLADTRSRMAALPKDKLQREALLAGNWQHRAQGWPMLGVAEQSFTQSSEQ